MIFHTFGEMKGSNNNNNNNNGGNNNNSNSYEERNGVFTKFQPFPLQQPKLTQKRDSHPDDAEVDSRGGGGGGGGAILLSPAESDPKKQKKNTAAGGGGDGDGDGASIEVVRRPRGRPPGSKNKPKPPMVITREAADSPNVMRPHILEIPAGHDIAEALSRFSRRRDLGLSVLGGTGPVSNVTLRQPSMSASTAASSTSTFTFHGRFEILSISATFFPPSFTACSSILPSSGGFSISLAGPHGQIVGGSVAGPLVAAGTVTVVAAAFSNPSFHRLPVDDDLSVSVSVSVSGDGARSGEVDAQQQHPHGGHQQQQLNNHHHGGASMAESAAPMPISSCHLLSDVIWAPTARTAHPPPY